MKKIIIIILIISFTIGGLSNILFPKNKDRIKSKDKTFLPEVTLQDLQNNKINLSKIDQPTILSFFLPQSKSCQEELKILSSIPKKYNNIKILAIGIGNIKKEDLINDLYKNLNYPILIDKKTELTKKLKISIIPTSIFYQPYNQPIKTIGLTDKKRLNQLIKTHFNL